jgi:apolipoprotein N-acyltransferase
MWALGCAALLVAMEMTIARIFGGFPWNLLGTSQYRIVPLIQIASLTGVAGVAFLVVWCSVSLINAALSILRRTALRSAWVGDIILPLAVVFGAFMFGFHRIRHMPEPGPELNVTLVQPSIPQTLIWDSAKDAERFEGLIRLSTAALTNETDLLIWPEAAVPSFARWDTNIFPVITNFVREQRVWLILGSDDIGLRDPPSETDRYEYYNASYLVNPEGKFVERYRKRNLVIFGEYIPFEHSLPFVKWILPAGQGSFTPGDKPVPFVFSLAAERQLSVGLGNPDPARPPPAASRERKQTARTSVLICYEDVFAQLVPEYAETNTDFLVNITNDGWFGEAAAMATDRRRSVSGGGERSAAGARANTGITCWIDANGRLRDVFTDQNGSVRHRIHNGESSAVAGGRNPRADFQSARRLVRGCVVMALAMVLL